MPTEHLEETCARPLRPGDPDSDQALRLALGAGPPADASRNVPDVTVGFREDCARRGVVADVLVGSFQRGQLRFACLLVEAPGHAALLLAPWEAIPSDNPAGARDATQLAISEARARDVALVEALVAVPSDGISKCLQECGLRRLTQLIYLQRRTSIPSPQLSTAADVEWVSYRPERESLFLDALAASYMGSLDCPELCGVRPLRDVLAGHRASGTFDPALWFVASRDGAPAGVLLLAILGQGTVLEIVYVGVAQVSRGTGVSDALLHRAVTTARASGATCLSLAVDNRNRWARKMYERWGFVEVARRDAWIAIPSRT